MGPVELVLILRWFQCWITSFTGVTRVTRAHRVQICLGPLLLLLAPKKSLCIVNSESLGPPQDWGPWACTIAHPVPMVVMALTSFLKADIFLHKHCKGGPVFVACLGPQLALIWPCRDVDSRSVHTRMLVWEIIEEVSLTISVKNFERVQNFYKTWNYAFRW